MESIAIGADVVQATLEKIVKLRLMNVKVNHAQTEGFALMLWLDTNVIVQEDTMDHAVNRMLMNAGMNHAGMEVHAKMVLTSTFVNAGPDMKVASVRQR